MWQKGKSERSQVREGFEAPLALGCRSLHVRTEENPLGATGTPTANSKHGHDTSVLEPQGTGLCPQPQ